MVQSFDFEQLSVSTSIYPSLISVAPNTIVLDAIVQMNQQQAGYVLVIDQERLVGIFTERDLVRAIAAGVELETTEIAALITSPAVTLKESELDDIAAALDQFRQHQIQYLPVVNQQLQVVQVLTVESLLQQEVRHRQQTEAQLRESKARLENAERLTHMGCWELDLATQDLIWSQEFFQICGLDPTQPAPSPEERLQQIHPNDRAWLQALYAQTIATGNPFYAEYQIIRPDGSTRYLEARGEGIFDQQGQLVKIVGAALDITDRKQIEAALQAKEELLSLALDFTQIAIWDWHIQTNQTIWNENAARLLDWPLDRLTVTPEIWLDRVHPEDRDRVWKSESEALANHTTHEVEYRIIRSDGRVRWILAKGHGVYDSAGQPSRMIGCMIDITDRKQTEQALQESEERFRAVFEQAAVGLSYVSEEGQFLMVNQKLCDILGYTQQELLCRRFQIVTYPEDLPQDLAYTQQLLTGEISVFAMEKRFIRKDGSLIWVNLTVSLMQQGEQKTLVAVMEEIGDRKQTEAALKAAYSDLEQRNAELEVLNEQLQTTLENLNQAEEELYQQNEELKVEHQRYQSLFDFAPDAYLVTDATGKIREANQTTATFLSVGRNYLIGKPLAVFMGARLRPTFYKHLTQLPTLQQTETWELSLQPRGGTAFPVEVTVAPMRDRSNGRTSFRWLLRDITSRKQTEAALRASEARFRAIFEQAAVGIVKTTYSNGQRGQILEVNQRFCDLLGYSELELLGLTLHDLTHPDHWNNVGQKIQQLIADEARSLSVEKQLVCKDGQLRWANSTISLVRDESGAPQYFINVFEDIQERKQAEAALRESQKFIQRIAETSPGMLFVYDLNNRSNIYVNQEVTQILGYTPEEIQAMGASMIQTVIYPDDRHILEAKHQRLAASANDEAIAYECRVYRKDGELRWLLNNITVFSRTAEGRLKQILGIATDITERKQTEAALQQAKTAAEAASLAKSEFLSRMSHELRTPLTAILGFAELLAGDSAISQENQENLAIISRSGESLLTLINDVLEMSKIEAGEITLDEIHCDLYHLLDEIEKLFRLKAAFKGLTLEFRRSAVPQFIFVDENKLRQVLINLLGNALKFTDEGSVTLQVSLRQSKTEGVSYPFALHFEVEDTGPGIASQEIATLFNAFSQTATGRGLQGGTGLGLAISQKFVQLMGGTITVHSQVNQGTRFAFDLPLTPTEAAQPPATDRRRVVGLAQGQADYRILVVDDEPSTRKILARLLAPLGFEVQEVVNGKEAIARWQSWRPHLIWMDMKMPAIDGYQATRQIRNLEEKGNFDASTQRTESCHPNPRANPRTVIIALTASAFQDQQSLAIAAGCDDFITKPFRQAVILEKMAEYLKLHYLYAESEQSPTFGFQLEQVEPESLKVDSLMRMSAEWIAALNVAASRLSSSQCLELIKQIPEDSSALANTLINLVESFRFDTILEVTQQSL